MDNDKERTEIQNSEGRVENSFVIQRTRNFN